MEIPSSDGKAGYNSRRGEQNATMAALRLVASDSPESQGTRRLLLDSTMTSPGSAAGRDWGGGGGGAQSNVLD